MFDFARSRQAQAVGTWEAQNNIVGSCKAVFKVKKLTEVRGCKGSRVF